MKISAVSQASDEISDMTMAQYKEAVAAARVLLVAFDAVCEHLSLTEDDLGLTAAQKTLLASQRNA